MDFTLSKEHEMARALFREFAEKEVKPLAIEVDETEVFPRETVWVFLYQRNTADRAAIF